MDKEINENIINTVNKMVAEYEPEKVILFGSHAWGKPLADSDVDLMVIKQTDKRKIDRQVELGRSLFPPFMPTDVLIYTPNEFDRRLKEHDPFVMEINKKGKVLYEAK